jgi:site-specific DNA-adenine methylase
MKSYNGGKSGSGTYQQIINHIPPHSIYVAPFAGHDGIFRNIRRATISILNDIDIDIANWWKAQKIKNCIMVEDFMQGNLFERPTRPVVIIRNNDYAYILKKFGNNPDAFIYCDPPYPMETRKDKRRIYKYDWKYQTHHEHFLELINSECKANLMVSSYPNQLYNTWLSTWHTHRFYSTIRGGRRVEEIIYMNYPPPTILHDFRYLGKDYRERENIKNKVNRHTERLNRLPQHERTAILSSFIQQYKDTVEKLIAI